MTIIRVRDCEACGKRARVLPNPYFQTGHAVHPEIAVCQDRRCGHTSFVPIAAELKADSELKTSSRRLTDWMLRPERKKKYTARARLAATDGA